MCGEFASFVYEQFLGQTNAKHGIFRFSLNDEYIGNALNEYGEFSEIEFSIMNKFIEKDDVVFDIGSNIEHLQYLCKKSWTKRKSFCLRTSVVYLQFT